MILKFREVEQSKLVALLQFADQSENKFVTTDPQDSKTGKISFTGPNPVIFLLDVKQTQKVAEGHRLMDVTLEILENHWVSNPGNANYPTKKEGVPSRIYQEACRLLGSFAN